MQERNEPAEDFVFQNPFTLTLGEKNDISLPLFLLKTSFFPAGPTQCGKSSFLHELIKSSRKKYSHRPGKFFFFYSVWQELYDEIDKLNYEIEWYAGMPDADFIHESVDSTGNDTLIFDDLAGYLNKSTVELFNVLSHHMHANVCFVVHNLFSKNVFFREISLNSRYICIYKNPRDSSSIFHFAR